MTSASSPATRLLKTWGDEAVVFDARSGDTHYLKPLTLALYQTCREYPGSTSDIVARILADRLSIALTSQFSDLVDDALASLRRADLLRHDDPLQS